MMLEHCLSGEEWKTLFAPASGAYCIVASHSNRANRPVRPVVMFLSPLIGAAADKSPSLPQTLLTRERLMSIVPLFQCTRWKTIYAPSPELQRAPWHRTRTGARKLASTSASVFPSLPIGALADKSPWWLLSLMNDVLYHFPRQKPDVARHFLSSVEEVLFSHKLRIAREW